MSVFITEVGCVGKTTVGEELADLLGHPFSDLDAEIESYFGTSIEHIQDRFLITYSYRKEASKPRLRAYPPDQVSCFTVERANFQRIRP